MRVLLLGPDNDRLAAFISAYGDEVVSEDRADWIVSYRHRELVPDAMIAAVNDQAINLHISALPWNGGADPNLHAWRDKTPHGISLHWMTQEIDRGGLIAQRRITFTTGETLRTSYMRLDAEAIALFMEYWPELRNGKRGSYHRSSDKPPLPHGWDTPVSDL